MIGKEQIVKWTKRIEREGKKKIVLERTHKGRFFTTRTTWTIDGELLDLLMDLLEVLVEEAKKSIEGGAVNGKGTNT